MLKDGDWQARYATIQALGNIGGDRVVELLKFGNVQALTRWK